MSKRVLIVGAGVVGLCAAYYARERGFEVTVVDRAGADRRGTSWGNAGFIVPSHFIPLAAPGAVAQGIRWMFDPESPFYVRPRLDPKLLSWGYRFWRSSTPEHVKRSGPLLRDLNNASRDCYEQLAERLGNPFRLERKGLLALCRTEKGLEEEAKVAEQARELGISASLLSQAEVQELQPGVELDVVGAVHFPDDASLDPGQFMATLQGWLEESGVTFHWNTAVKGWQSKGGTLTAAVTSAGEVEADEVVLAAGIWSDDLTEGLGAYLPMRPGKGYSMTLPEPRQPLTTPAILSEARVAASPLDGAVRFGGTMEIAGIEEMVRPRRVSGIIKSVSRYFPDYRSGDFESAPVWYGFRPCTPDGLPYLGRSRAAENLLVATGHAMMGLSLGPISGKLVAQQLAGEELPERLRLLDPDRFAGRRMGGVAGTLSRRAARLG